MSSYPPPNTGFDPRAQRDQMRAQERLMRAQSRAQRDALRAQQDQLRYRTRGLRRSSILGPLLLVGFGVVVLLLRTGRIPSQNFWGFYAHWWPLLLLLAGAILLAEWGVDQYLLNDPARPQYRRSVGGGIVFLLILSGIGGVFSHIAEFHMDPGMWMQGMNFDPDNFNMFLGDKHEADQTLDRELPAHASLNVSDPRGDVKIVGTSGDALIHVTLHKEVFSSSDSDAEGKFQQLDMHFNVVGDSVTLTVPAVKGAHASLSITIPPGVPVTVNADRGNVSVSGLQAAVALVANHGDVELSAISGAVSAHLNHSGAGFSARGITGGVALEGRSGDVTLADVTGSATINGDFFGTTHLEHIGGSVAFHTSRTDLHLAHLDGRMEISPRNDLSADRAVGPVTISTRNRNIMLDGIAGEVSVTNRNGRVNLASALPLGNVTIDNRNGSVRILVPDRTSFAVRAETSNGSIQNDFALSTQGTESHRTLNGTVGGGGPLVHITTTNGDISINKGTAKPAI